MEFMRDIESCFPETKLSDPNNRTMYFEKCLLVNFPEHPLYTPRYLGKLTSKASRIDFPSENTPHSQPDGSIDGHDEDDARQFHRIFDDVQETLTSNRTLAGRMQKKLQNQIEANCININNLKMAQEILGLRPSVQKSE